MFHIDPQFIICFMDIGQLNSTFEVWISLGKSLNWVKLTWKLKSKQLESETGYNYKKYKLMPRIVDKHWRGSFKAKKKTATDYWKDLRKSFYIIKLVTFIKRKKDMSLPGKHFEHIYDHYARAHLFFLNSTSICFLSLCWFRPHLRNDELYKWNCSSHLISYSHACLLHTHTYRHELI